jgi:ABC-type multidrug transport system fused ATPase/permease subunit
MKLTQPQPMSAWRILWTFISSHKGWLAFGLAVVLTNRAATLVLPTATKYLVDDIIVTDRRDLLLGLLLVVLSSTAVQGLTSFLLLRVVAKAGHEWVAELRQQVQAHLGSLPIAYYDSTKTGTLVARVMQDVEAVRYLMGVGLVEFAGGLITALIAFVVLVRLNLPITLFAFSALILFAFALKKGFGRIRPAIRERSRINAEVMGRLTESVSGVRVVKSYRAEEYEQRVFGEGVGRLLKNTVNTLTGTALVAMSSSILTGLVGAMVIYLGARQIMAGNLSLGGFFTYIAFLGYLINPVFLIVTIGTQVTEAIAGLERTHEVLSTPPEDDPERTIAIGEIEGSVRFDHLSFEYNHDKPVLKDINFVAAPGTVTALVGSSGAGKSTIVGLVAAFYKPVSGKIFIDGIDLDHVQLASYRKNLGVVLQESFLFDGTIQENVAFSRPTATEEEIVHACRLARVDEFAERFPDHYATVIGERGVKLSGGQRQRISIARAILACPKILILDEATSSLDSESEALIQQGLFYLMRSRTSFVIAHRLSTIRNADQILVVEGGEIVERGRHEELYMARGRYYELYTRQHRLEENLFLAPGEGDPLTENRVKSTVAEEPRALNPDRLHSPEFL